MGRGSQKFSPHPPNHFVSKYIDIMRKTVLITGTSSGIGGALVEHFSKENWNIAATMRSPEKHKDLARFDNVKLYQLDVVDKDSIKEAIDAAINDFGKIDVLVNNAGYGAVGIFEKATDEQIRKQFDVNVFGVMNVIREILPHFRERKDGTIINITSIGGLITFPIYSVYHASKWAVDGFSESLHFELKPLGIRVKNIEPGAIKTDFYSRSQDLFINNNITDYDRYEQVCLKNIQERGEDAPPPSIVAKKVLKAANSKSFKLRYPVGNRAPLMLFIRRILPNSWFFAIVRSVLERGFSK